MNSKKKLLSLLTALAISASAFAGLAIPAGAEGENTGTDNPTVTETSAPAGSEGEDTGSDNPAATGTPAPGTGDDTGSDNPAATETPAPGAGDDVQEDPSPAWTQGKVNETDPDENHEWITYQGKDNVLHLKDRNMFTTVSNVSEGTVNFNTNVYIDPAVERSFRIIFQNDTGVIYNQDTAFAQAAVNAGGKVYVGPALDNTGSNTELFTPAAAGWYNFDITLDYSKAATNEFITVTVKKDGEETTLGTQKIGAINGKDTTLKAIRLVKTASEAYFEGMKVTPASIVTAATPIPTETEAPVTETEAPATETTSAPSGEGSQNNSINISENFESATQPPAPTLKPDATPGATPEPAPTTWEYKNEAEGYTWDAIVSKDWSGKNQGLSLSANKDKTILTFADGVGGPQKDVKIDFTAGVVKAFGQAAATWEMVFKSTSGNELFKLFFHNGDNYTLKTALIAGGKTQQTNYTYGDKVTPKHEVYVSFGTNGGEVKFGNVSAKFDAGYDIGTISVTKAGAGDQDRPYIIDNFNMSTVDKEKVEITVKSDNNEKSVEGAQLVIGEDTYTVPADGKVEAYYIPGTYDYSLKLAEHKAKNGTLTVEKAGEKKVGKFVDVDLDSATLLHAYYKDGALESVKSENVTITGGEYAVTPVEKAGLTEKFMLWSALSGNGSMIPVGKYTEETKIITNDNELTLEFVGPAVPTRIEIAGGEEYIYLPAAGGTTTSKAFTATVYDNADLIMEDAVVEWSLPGQPNTISINENGVITLTPDFTITDDNGADVKVTATVSGTTVSADTEIHIHNTARATTWDIVGPAVIKSGTQAEYKIENVKDQYGNKYTGEAEFVLTSTDATAVIDGLKITPNVETSRTESVTITAALSSNPQAKAEREVTVYGYDFYEPGVGQASYGNPRMEVVNKINSIVWPVGNSSTEITLPTPVELKPGSAKMITFDNIMVNKEISAQERSLKFLNSKGETVLLIGYAGKTVVKDDYAKSGDSYGGTEIGQAASFGESASATFVIKTDAAGKSSVILKYNEGILPEYTLEKGGDIAKIVMTSGNGVPNERQLTLTNLIIADSDVPEVEIVGDDKLAKISGSVATKKFKGSIFSQAEGETFTWSVADKQGQQISGVSIDEEGVLSVTDDVAADTVAVISYTSSLSTTEAPKFATKEVTIKDFAAVKSFTVDGPVAVNAGETVTYSAKSMVDEYGDKVIMPVSYAITAGNDIASIDAKTGVATTTGKFGKYTVSVTVGNPGKTTTKTIEAEVAKYSEVGTASGNSVEVDVSALANYAADTKYRVTTAKSDGTLVKMTDDVAHTNGKVTVDTTDADKYEVSPIYSFNNVGNVASGKKIPLCDGLYDFTFKKTNGTRADIYVNGNMVGNNVDQSTDTVGRGGSTGSYYSVNDVVVQGGSATVMMKDNDSNMTSIVVRKAPTIVPRKTHVYILGDSLVANYYGPGDDKQYGTPDNLDAQTGWGQVMHKFISDELNITNLAESGSTVVRNGGVGLFETAFPSVLASAKPGDYLIWEAGYNDYSYSDESKMAKALQSAAEDCKLAGINLILSTPNFGPGHGTTNSANVRFGPKVLEVAKDNHILGINLSGDLYAKYQADTNPEKSTYWSRNFHAQKSGGGADLHMSWRGAMQNACIAAQAIYNAQHDTENPELAAALAGLKINTEAQTVTDTEGATLTFQVQTAE